MREPMFGIIWFWSTAVELLWEIENFNPATHSGAMYKPSSTYGTNPIHDREQRVRVGYLKLLYRSMGFWCSWLQALPII